MQDLPAMGSVQAMKLEFTTIERLSADYDVLSRDQFGATTIRVTYRDFDDDVKTKADDKPSPQTAMDADVTALKRAFRGASFTFKQAPNGAIWSVNGAEALSRRLFKAVPLNDPSNALSRRLQMEDVVRKFGPNQVAKKLGAITSELPLTPVRVGENWEYKIKSPDMGAARFVTGRHTLQSLTPTLAMISHEAKLGTKVDENSAGAAANGGEITFDDSQLSGTQSGYTRVDRASGVPLEVTLNNTFGGTLIMKSASKSGQAEQLTPLPMNTQFSERIVLIPR